MPDEDVDKDKGGSSAESSGGGTPTQPDLTPTERRIEDLRVGVASANTSEQIQDIVEDVAAGERSGTSPEQGAVVAIDTNSIEGTLKSIGSGIVESRKAKMDEYRDRIDAVNRGEELVPGDRENAQQLMTDYLRMGGARPDTSTDEIVQPVDLSPRAGDPATPEPESASPPADAVDQPAGTSSGVEAPAEPPVPPVEPPPTDTGAEDSGDNNGDESSDVTPPEPPLAVAGGLNPEGDEMARLHSNIEAIAQQREGVEARAPEPIIVSQALMDSVNQAQESGTWNGGPDGISSEDIRQVLTQLNPDLTDEDIQKMAAENQVFPLISAAVAEGRIKVGEPEPINTTTEPSGSETTQATPPLAEDEADDDDVDFSHPNPIGGTPPEPAPTADDEPPEGETPPDEGAEHGAGDAVTGAGGGAELPEDPEERLRSMYERISPEARDARAKKLRKHISRLESRMNNLSSLDQMETLQSLIDNAQLDLDLVEDVQKEKNDPNTPDSKNGSIDANDEDLARKLEETMDEYRTIGESTFDQLQGKEKSENNVIEGLRDKLKKTKGRERSVIEAKIAEAEARLGVIRKFKKEKETGHIEERNAEAIRETEQRRRELGEVGYLDENIKKNKADLEGIDKNILDIEAKILKAKEGSVEWKRLNNEKLELSKRANKIRETLRLDEDALKAAKEKEKKEKGTSTVPTLENIDQKTDTEFGMMSRTDQTKYLETVGRVLPQLTEADFNELNAKALAGQPLSIEQRAYLQREISTRLLNGTYDAKCLTKLGAHYGEVSDMVVEKFMRSKQLEKWRRENCPTGWEKMIDLAKKYPAILAILALLIAGGVVSSGGVLPAIGAAAGGTKSILG